MDTKEYQGRRNHPEGYELDLSYKSRLLSHVSNLQKSLDFPTIDQVSLPSHAKGFHVDPVPIVVLASVSFIPPIV